MLDVDNFENKIDSSPLCKTCAEMDIQKMAYNLDHQLTGWLVEFWVLWIGINLCKYC